MALILVQFPSKLLSGLQNVRQIWIWKFDEERKPKMAKTSALKRLKMVFSRSKSPPQAENFENPKSISHYSPLVIDNFSTRGGIVARISPDVPLGSKSAPQE